MQTQNQTASDSQPFVSSKKLRNLSNENNKMQNNASGFKGLRGQVQQSQNNDFSQNQISDQSTKNGNFLINLPKDYLDNVQGDVDPFELSGKSLASTVASSVQDNSNSNCNSDVEIIEDDYAKTLQPMTPSLIHSKSTTVNPNQTTSACGHNHNHTHACHRPAPLWKQYSTYSTY